MQLAQFKRNEGENSIHLKFDDGFESDITLKELRENCPCAGCKGEEVLLHKYIPEKKNFLTWHTNWIKRKPLALML